MMINQTDLLINPDGSIFHLHLKPGDIADTVIAVGDPGRVMSIKAFMDTIDIEVHNREFYTLTGYYKSKRITVMSTGIGVSNIDIAMNELDALVNIDFDTRQVKEKLTQLNFIRLGTTGGLQEHVKPGSYVLSDYAIGFDNLACYMDANDCLNHDMTTALRKHAPQIVKRFNPYAVKADSDLNTILASGQTQRGITLTAPGFYAAQGRTVRIPVSYPDLLNDMSSFKYNNVEVLNLEMESAAMFHYALKMQHRASTLCLVLANRISNEALLDYQQAMNELIEYLLGKIASATNTL